MKYINLDRKAKELKRKYKELQIICKDKKLQGEKSIQLNEYEKELFNKYVFFDELKKRVK